MSIEDRKPGATEIETLLDGMREMDAAPSPDFLARIEVDALAEMPGAAADLASPPGSAQATGFLARLFGAIGGAPAAAGLAVAAVAGGMLGYTDTVLLDTATQALGYELLDYDIGDLFADLPADE